MTALPDASNPCWDSVADGYTTCGCAVPYLTQLSQSEIANFSESGFVPKCDVTYSEFIGAEYDVFSYVLMGVCGVSTLIGFWQTSKMIKAYGRRSVYTNNQVIMHLKVVLQAAVQTALSFDLYGYSTLYPHQLGLIFRVVANSCAYSNAVSVVFVWIRTAAELSIGHSVFVDRRERISNITIGVTFAGLLLLALAWKDIPFWLFNVIFFTCLSIITLLIAMANWYYGCYIYRDFSKTTKSLERGRQSISGKDNKRTSFSKGGMSEAEKSKNASLRRLLKIMVCTSIVAILATIFQFYFILQMLTKKYGVKPDDNHQELAITGGALGFRSILFLVALLEALAVLFFFSNMKKAKDAKSVTSPRKSTDLSNQRRSLSAKTGTTTTARTSVGSPVDRSVQAGVIPSFQT